ncbi:hypothetical protein XM38_018020 [Halomicronema hongdechloris C2206]|uniref:Uncharacterized protein n=1 Tax=Halomicronema hongdechloris C2206 TaxID=1641165 RepID=A0A1Z3HKN9_9CYAN|nr:hypothetical protein [Halomicronema hongdechloris]ASC70855.1 hypothetical protein XM38_018020 [Halomicronema hongdechloris C2206]
MTEETLARAKAEYAAGQQAFERGNYGRSVQYFERAVLLAKKGTPLGGEIQTWLVNAYAAADRQQDAIALCQSLSRHPDSETRKQGKRLLYILKAPRLQLRPEWKTEIPDLANLDEGTQVMASRYSQGPRRPPTPAEPPPPIDPSQINRQDNRFLWMALGLVGGLLAAAAWWS